MRWAGRNLGRTAHTNTHTHTHRQLKRDAAGMHPKCGAVPIRIAARRRPRKAAPCRRGREKTAKGGDEAGARRRARFSETPQAAGPSWHNGGGGWGARPRRGGGTAAAARGLKQTDTNAPAAKGFAASWYKRTLRAAHAPRHTEKMHALLLATPSRARSRPGSLGRAARCPANRRALEGASVRARSRAPHGTGTAEATVRLDQQRGGLRQAGVQPGARESIRAQTNPCRPQIGARARPRRCGRAPRARRAADGSLCGPGRRAPSAPRAKGLKSGRTVAAAPERGRGAAAQGNAQFQMRQPRARTRLHQLRVRPRGLAEQCGV
ncbi:hypothetical protein Rsub_00133 [Raphidocelis subcapitata]|uniref:Uncharacterized protein n=1 Tax=Raphidocelis subcapitata TaxID=307507 RepID=A0A2V0NM14_9CHLO|nr:hypothetical protein Rsub_00133 [Raphidocelis subcapitata]|eukprot:GBF87422.1 hypothetical protein Rsub_00133 [Raphidocelis subcapitata]